MRLTYPSEVQADLHRLVVLGQLGGWRDSRRRVADALVALDRKAAAQQLARDRFWPIRVEEIARTLGATESTLGAAVLGHEEFGRPDHILFVKPLKLDPATAARKFLAAAKDDPDYGWTPGLVTLLGALPPTESRPVLLQLWERGGLEDAIVGVLAKTPEAEDSPRFVVGLRSLDTEVVRVSAEAIVRLKPAADHSDVVAAVKALRRVPDDKAGAPARAALVALLRNRTGQTIGPDPNAWAAWVTKAHPTAAAKLTAVEGFDAAAWKARTERIDWATGDAVSGRKVFAKATCAACHDGGGAVGPSLQGVGKRFGRDDLLTAILDPGRDVSPRYRPTRIVTSEGKAVVGMIIYEATDGVILQTGPDTTVRIAGGEMESKRVIDVSLMPAGLLDKLTDREVADLLAYLRTFDR